MIKGVNRRCKVTFLVVGHTSGAELLHQVGRRPGRRGICYVECVVLLDMGDSIPQRLCIFRCHALHEDNKLRGTSRGVLEQRCRGDAVGVDVGDGRRLVDGVWEVVNGIALFVSGDLA